MAIVINLVRDWEDIQLDEFKNFIDAWGFASQILERYLNAPPDSKARDELREEALMTWFNYQHRRPLARSRKLMLNPSLVCPHEVARGWAMLQQEIKVGADLTSRLSRTIENPDRNDGMLNDWGFHHFHLGTSPDRNHPRLMEGTRIVLAAIVDESTFYPVDFIPHNSWDDKAILKKAISAFPERFERFCLKGVEDIASSGAEENVSEMRKHGVNLFSKIGGKIYFPPGLGITTASTSVAATMRLDQCRRQFQKLENQLRIVLGAQCFTGKVRLIRDPSAENSFRIEMQR